MVKVEGYSPEELLALPAVELDAFVFVCRPVVVKLGSAELLAECSHRGATLLVDLAHIDGGGEGALPTLSAFLSRFAGRRGFEQIRRGFEVRTMGAMGDCYYKMTPVGLSHRQR
jgi:hypothetical protein